MDQRSDTGKQQQQKNQPSSLLPWKLRAPLYSSLLFFPLTLGKEKKRKKKRVSFHEEKKEEEEEEKTA